MVDQYFQDIGMIEVPIKVEVPDYSTHEPTQIQCKCGGNRFEVAYTDSYETSIRCMRPKCSNKGIWVTVHTG